MDKSLTLPRKWLKSEWVAGFCTAQDSAGKRIFSTRAIDEPDLYLWIKDVHYPQLTARQYRTALRDLCKETLPGYKESLLSSDLRGLLNKRIKEIGKRLWVHQKIDSEAVPNAAAVAAGEQIDEAIMPPTNQEKSLNQDEINTNNLDSFGNKVNAYEPVFGQSGRNSIDNIQHQQTITSFEQESAGSYSNSNGDIQYRQSNRVHMTSNTSNTYAQVCGGSYSNSNANIQHLQSNRVHMGSASNVCQQGSGGSSGSSSSSNAHKQHQQSSRVHMTSPLSTSNAYQQKSGGSYSNPNANIQQQQSNRVQMGINPCEQVGGCSSSSSSNANVQHQQSNRLHITSSLGNTSNANEQAHGGSYSHSNNMQHQLSNTVRISSNTINTYAQMCGGGGSNSANANIQHQQSNRVHMTSPLCTSNSHQESGGSFRSTSNANMRHQKSNRVHMGSASNACQQNCIGGGSFSNSNLNVHDQQSNTVHMGDTMNPYERVFRGSYCNLNSNIQHRQLREGQVYNVNSSSSRGNNNNNNNNNTNNNNNNNIISSSGSMPNTNEQHSPMNTNPLLSRTHVVPNHTEIQKNVSIITDIQKNTNSFTCVDSTFGFPEGVGNSSKSIMFNNRDAQSLQSMHTVSTSSMDPSSNTNNQHFSQTSSMPTTRLSSSNFETESSTEPLPKRLAVARVYVKNRDRAIDYETSTSQTRDGVIEPNEHVMPNVTSSVCMSVPTVGIQTPPVAHTVIRPEFDILRFDNVDRDVDNDNGDYISTKRQTTKTASLAAGPEFGILPIDAVQSNIINDDINNNNNDNDNDNIHNDIDNNNHITVDMQITTSTLSATARSESLAPPVGSTVARHAFDVIRFDDEESDDHDDDDDVGDMACENLPFQFAEDSFFVPLENEEMKQAFNDIHAGLSDFGLVSKSEYHDMEKHYTSCFSNPSVVGFAVHYMTIHTTGRLDSYVNQIFTDFVGIDLTKEGHVIVDYPTTQRGLALMSDDNAADIINVPSAWIDCFDESGKPIKKLADMWFPNIKYNTDEAVLMFTPPNSTTLLRQPGPYPPES